MIEKMSESEYDVYRYLTEHDIQEMTAGEIATKFYVGRSMLTRVCQKMGYASFGAYKYAQARPALVESAFRIGIEQITTSLSMRDLEAIDRTLMNASRVFVYGTVASGIAGMYLGRQLTNLGIFNVCVSDRFQFEKLQAMFRPGDVLICVSHSGENVEMNTNVKTIGIPIIAITKRASTLARVLASWCLGFDIDANRSEHAFDREDLFPIFVVLQNLLLSLRQTHLD
ncbi:MurR/RpiR family transcriptional regulator [Lacticaseibacillus daqingensis]|uniref:MurR/RpiR family transcriptional regulator n=1 Tax=Lacticaseibacillus daqingensis TaxID=2486014 RepID=UPI0013DDF73E|nr:MurR/RpiR family transcriptional regulator [Lacticaseibacillus daqingensis]